MPNCKLCSNRFPTSKVIDGKLRVFNNRRYCLDCSPFGAHNTQRLRDKLSVPVELESFNEDMVCISCSRPYVYNKKIRRGHIRGTCNTCLVNDRRFEIRQKLIDYKGGKCQSCGYNKYAGSLTFHHKDPKEKEFGISGKYCYKLERLIKEVDKCVLVCANCHGEIHAGLRPLPD